jgi:hypothetical protein
VDRELVFLVFSALTLGPLLLLAGMQRTAQTQASSACGLQRDCWRRLWAPLLPSAIVFGALVGWVVIEPEQAERLPVPLIVIGVPIAVVWVRALVRALWGLRRASAVPTAATFGLFRPRMAIAPEFLRVIDDAARDAVTAHEAAHVRHRDPLRLWAAQLATDLQWPGRGATERLAQWRHALELARDEEIRRQGVDGADLAAAVIVALRLGSMTTAGGVSIVGSHEGVRDRIHRLLVPLPTIEEEAPPPRSLRAATIAGPLGAAVLGASFGEAVVRALAHLMQ